MEFATHYSVYTYKHKNDSLRKITVYFKSGSKKSEALQKKKESKFSSEGFFWQTDGEYTEWYENGKPFKVINYMNGKNDGKLILFWKNGQTKRDDLFHNGELIVGKCIDSLVNEIEYFPYEVMPEFPGGENGLKKYLSKNIRYPLYSQMRGIQGRVLVIFVVAKSGSIIKTEIKESVSPDIDAEALRLVKRMPKWKPGLQDGEAVDVKYILPINFRLQ